MDGHQIEAQRNVFAFLADPATHDGQPVRRIDTHAAAVFLAGQRAYKVKRAVRFPFLDFSTLARRETACRAEITANRPFAAELYLAVVPITLQADGTLALAGGGETVEWAVVMRRFDEDRTLDRLADRNELGLDTIERLASGIAESHRQAPPSSAVEFVTDLGSYLDQNDRELRGFPELFRTTRISELTAASRESLTAVRALLLSRGETGRMRHGHGDLHLGNVALIGNRPVPFDALEFDRRIASGDVLYDLAFLLMDLVQRHMPEGASLALNRYLVEAGHDGDLDALAALPLFMSLRAAIRAKVTAARLGPSDPSGRDAIAAAAVAYFDLALSLISPPRPTLVAIGGLSGTGKSVLARRLAPDLLPLPGAIVLRSDIERKKLFGVEETARLPAVAYAAEVTETVYARLRDKATKVIAAGHSAIVDAVFARAEERKAVRAIAGPFGVAFHGLFLTADLAVRIGRVGGRTGDASDADEAVARAQEGYDLADLDWPVVDAGGTPDQTLAGAKAAIAPDLRP